MRVGTNVVMLIGNWIEMKGIVWATSGTDQTCLVRFQTKFNRKPIVTNWIPWSDVQEVTK